MTKFKYIAALFISLVITIPVKAAIINTTTITLNASGSLNSISGTGHINGLLNIGANDTLEYFSLELTDFQTTPDVGLPQSLSMALSYGSSSPSGIYWNLNTGIYIGKSFDIALNTSLGQDLYGFIEGSGTQTRNITTGMAWGFGGVDASATALITLTAHGQVSAVPLPPAILLFISGITLLLGFNTKRKES